ncbi:MAG: hypothetical protein ABI451_12775, partial [Dokdonella sp.]
TGQNCIVRHSLLNPIPELNLAANLLDTAVDALLAGRRARAQELVASANFPEITQYAKRLVGKMSEHVHRQITRPKCLTKSDRDPARMPSRSAQDVIFARDGWRCRFCGIKVICKAARSQLS